MVFKVFNKDTMNVCGGHGRYSECGRVGRMSWVIQGHRTYRQPCVCGTAQDNCAGSEDLVHEIGTDIMFEKITE